MKNRRLLIVILCFFVIAGIAFAGGKKEIEPAGGGEAETVVLTFTDFQSGNDGILSSYKEIIGIFEKENPGFTVDYQQYTVTTYNEYLKPALAGGNPPDLLAVYPGTDTIDVVNAGALLNLKPLIDAEWKGWLGPAYNFKGININNGIYLVPQDVWTEAIWYHKDMLEEIGVDLKDALDSFSVEEYIAMVEPAKAKGYDVMLAGFIETWSYFDAFFNFVHQQQPGESPDMVEQAMNGDISWQQDIFSNAIEVFVKLNNGGVWRKDTLNMDYQVQAFGKWLEKESIFMWSQGDWFASAMKPEDNNMDNPSIGIIQYPLVNKNSVVAFNKNFGTDIGVSSKTKYQDQAVAFAKLTNSPAAAEIFIRNGVNPAAGIDPNNIPKTDNPIFNDCIELYNSPGRYSEVYYFNSDAVKAIGDGIGNVLLGLDNIDSVLAQLDEITGYK